LVEPGELDQEQHDGVRDVFACPGSCLLVRADLFATLDGFDPMITGPGEDIDLCWRAQVAGARVIVAPDARVRHVHATHEGLREGGHTRTTTTAMGARYRLRTVLKCYGVVHLIRVVPQAVLLALGELLWSGLTGNRPRARAVMGAWSWNLNHIRDLRAARAKVQAQRNMSDGELRRLQVRGSARVAAFLRDQLSTDAGTRSVASVSRGLAGSFREGSYRVPIIVWTAVVAVLFFGTRDLLFGTVPAVGQLVPFPDGTGTFLRLFASGWRTVGLGAAAAAPAALGLLGIGSAVFLGGTGLLRQVLIIGCLPVGVAGAYRLARPLGSRRACLAASVVYLAVPVFYNSLARGRAGGLLVYAAAPFLLRRLAEVTGLPPFADDGPFDTRRLIDRAVPLGILLALLAAFVPAAIALVPALAIFLAIGSLAAGAADRVLRAVAAAGLAVLLAAALLFPWTFEMLGSEWAAFTGVAGPESRALSLGQIVRFHTGPIGSAPLGWAFLVVAALPLLIGRDWRLGWAIRLWAVAIGCWGLAWAAGQGWLGFPLHSPEILLAPAAAALALCAALGALAFEIDLPGYAFGWRQVASSLAVVALGLGALPVVAASAGGRWLMPEQDYETFLGWLPAQREAGSFRVLWIGDP
ncbi:MAG: glycosyltransferase family 2 protein, partial [Catenulispora sp.]